MLGSAHNYRITWCMLWSDQKADPIHLKKHPRPSTSSIAFTLRKTREGFMSPRQNGEVDGTSAHISEMGIVWPGRGVVTYSQLLSVWQQGELGTPPAWRSQLSDNPLPLSATRGPVVCTSSEQVQEDLRRRKSDQNIYLCYRNFWTGYAGLRF